MKTRALIIGALGVISLAIWLFATRGAAVSNSDPQRNPVTASGDIDKPVLVDAIGQSGGTRTAVQLLVAVSDSAGQPIPFSTITTIERGVPIEWGADEDGTVSLPPSAKQLIRVVAKGFLTRYLVADRAGRLSVILKRSASLHLHLADPAGEPLVGITAGLLPAFAFAPVTNSGNIDLGVNIQTGLDATESEAVLTLAAELSSLFAGGRSEMCMADPEYLDGISVAVQNINALSNSQWPLNLPLDALQAQSDDHGIVTLAGVPPDLPMLWGPVWSGFVSFRKAPGSEGAPNPGSARWLSPAFKLAESTVGREGAILYSSAAILGRLDFGGVAPLNAEVLLLAKALGSVDGLGQPVTSREVVGRYSPESDGSFFIEGLAPGSYHVQATWALPGNRFVFDYCPMVDLQIGEYRDVGLLVGGSGLTCKLSILDVDLAGNPIAMEELFPIDGVGRATVRLVPSRLPGKTKKEGIFPYQHLLVPTAQEVTFIGMPEGEYFVDVRDPVGFGEARKREGRTWLPTAKTSHVVWNPSQLPELVVERSWEGRGEVRFLMAVGPDFSVRSPGIQLRSRQTGRVVQMNRVRNLVVAGAPGLIGTAYLPNGTWDVVGSFQSREDPSVLLSLTDVLETYGTSEETFTCQSIVASCSLEVKWPALEGSTRLQEQVSVLYRSVAGQGIVLGETKITRGSSFVFDGLPSNSELVLSSCGHTVSTGEPGSQVVHFLE